MNSFRNPSDEQWRNFLLREGGRPFDPREIESWQAAFHYNLALGANESVEGEDPTDDTAIVKRRESQAAELDLNERHYFAVSLPHDNANIDDKASLYEHLANIVETYGVKHVGAITLQETLDYDGEGYYPYLIVWLFRPLEQQGTKVSSHSNLSDVNQGG